MEHEHYLVIFALSMQLALHFCKATKLYLLLNYNTMVCIYLFPYAGIFWGADMHIKLRKAWRGLRRSRRN